MIVFMGHCASFHFSHSYLMMVKSTMTNAVAQPGD
jgi:hypothetical protein